jgi:hypothetical protein
VSETDIQRVEDKLNTPREVFFNAKDFPVALRC